MRYQQRNVLLSEKWRRLLISFEDMPDGPASRSLVRLTSPLPGQDPKQFSVRDGSGGDCDVRGAAASLMKNDTAEGQDPAVRVRFKLDR